MIKNKKALYESIMRKVSRVVKSALNEQSEMSDWNTFYVWFDDVLDLWRMCQKGYMKHNTPDFDKITNFDSKYSYEEVCEMNDNYYRPNHFNYIRISYKNGTVKEL